MTAIAIEKQGLPSRLAYRQLHRIADRLEPGLRRAFLLAVQRLRQSVCLAPLLQAGSGRLAGAR